jgi:hypothetical protein
LLLAFPAIFVLAVACGGGDDGRASPAQRTSTQSAPTATDAEVQALAKVPIPGYATEEGGTTLLGVAAVYRAEKPTAGGAQLYVRANFAPCDDFVCASLDPKDYQSAEAQDNMKSVLPAAHKANPDLLWEFGTVKLSNDATGLYYYALSYLEQTTGAGVSRSSANSYRAWYHNGSVYLTLEVFARGTDGPLSRADVEKSMTKAEAEAAARAVFATLEPKLPH